jgi:hypothetical protein
VDLDWSVPLGDGWRQSGTWTIVDAKYTQFTSDGGESGTPAVLDGLRIYNTAQYTGAASLGYTPTGESWSARVSGNWVGPYSPFDEPGVVLGGYGLLHLSGTTQFAGAEWTAGVRNALDRAYPELVAGHIVAPGQPRAFELTVRRKF